MIEGLTKEQLLCRVMGHEWQLTKWPCKRCGAENFAEAYEWFKQAMQSKLVERDRDQSRTRV